MNLLKYGIRMKIKMKNNKKYFLIIALIFIIIPLIIYINSNSFEQQDIVSGQIESSETDISSKIPGRIRKILIAEGDVVNPGDTLAVLESAEMDAKREQARAFVSAAEAKYKMVKAGARSEEKRAAGNLYIQTKHQYALADSTWKRMNIMYKERLISAQERDHYKFLYDSAFEQMEAAGAKYEMALNGARPEEILMAESAYHQAEAALKEAEAYHSELTLTSSIKGRVTQIIADEGEIISAGYPVISIQNDKNIKAILNIREDAIDGILEGDVFIGEIPAFGNRKIKFRVSFIAPMADFATWKPTNQKGGFDLRTFEVHLIPEESKNKLKAGMTVNFDLKAKAAVKSTNRN
ncbi:MAG: efflux RND transporter periplasmic adaptor subunit [Ignavibacteriales bacterium]|nr:efflux RND transporter periplasmic adaptor subunit [Ignavibacteriales bacterium]MCF8438678.1 efflux RND transporter periplasmic adaptor subunit [Ignavibacteriales bacterium]